MGGGILPFVSYQLQETSDKVRILFFTFVGALKMILIRLMNALTWGGVALLSCRFPLSWLVTSLLVGTEDLSRQPAENPFSARVL